MHGTQPTASSSEGTLAAQVERTARRAADAARTLASAPRARKDAVLRRIASHLRDPSIRSHIERANAEDLRTAEARGLSGAMVDRLRLGPARIERMAESCEQVAALPDPVGEVERMQRLPNGLWAGRMRVPLGLVAIVYESRPDVTVEAAALCLKAGDAVVLRGGSEAFHSNRALASLVSEALESEGLPAAAVSLLPTTDRAAIGHLIALEGVVDLVIPRGGKGLIRFVTEHARVPVVQHYEGVCHVYVDGAADLPMALRIVVDAKTQRPGVCNAMETLLVDRAIAPRFLPDAAQLLRARGVELRGCAETRRWVPDAMEATEADWAAEYLDLVLAVRVVDGIQAAMDHVARWGSRHTEAIVTTDYLRAQRWLREVDASLVLVNASTRFNDGYELGLGAEVGISTSKVHCYGPMGLRELCTTKWIAHGDGQTRGTAVPIEGSTALEGARREREHETKG